MHHGVHKGGTKGGGSGVKIGASVANWDGAILKACQQRQGGGGGMYVPQA